MNEVLEQFGKLGIIPVVKIDNVKDAEPLAQALCDGGLPVAEVTFRTAAAKDAIKAMSSVFPNMLVGAGTVLTTAQVDDALEAGAKFIVSPGLNPKVVAYCQEKGVPVTPGVTSPTEIETALELGLEVVKFFPAEASGGLAKIKAMSAPYGNLKFMPTGGINANNLKDYLDFPKVLACGGSWMVSGDLINAGKFDQIRDLTEEAVTKMLGFSLLHVGINEDGAGAAQAADRFAEVFGFAKNEAEISYFCGDGIEVMKRPGRGAMGHLAIATNYLERAMYYLERKGVEWIPETVQYNAKGKPVFIYLKEEIGGFAVHLKQK